MSRRRFCMRVSCFLKDTQGLAELCRGQTLCVKIGPCCLSTNWEEAGTKGLATRSIESHFRVKTLSPAWGRQGAMLSELCYRAVTLRISEASIL